MLHRRRALALATAAMALGGAGTAQAAETLYGLTAGDELVTLGTDAPGSVSAAKKITGLQAGDVLAGIDVRPSTGQVYAVALSGRIYVVDPVTASARLVNEVAISGTNLGVDFNPAADALRIVSDTGKNYRVTQGGVGPVVNDTDLSSTGIVGAAYTSNFNGTGSTRLLDVDATNDRLVFQNPPNAGTLVDVGALGVDVGPDASFDIAASGDGFLTANGRLYTVDLSTGQATDRGPLGAPLKGITAARQAPVLYALAENGTTIQTASSVRGLGIPGIFPTSSREVRGLPMGVTLVGLDTRPADGLLVGLGSDGSTYAIEPESGKATALGGTATLGGGIYGVDFNPAANALRVTSSLGQNLRYPMGGAGAAVTDGMLTGGFTVAEGAYTNNVAGATATQLLNIDTAGDQLVLQNPPNNGTLTAVGPLGTDLDGAGFDILGQDGAALLAGSPAGGATSNLYRVDLRTGTASLVAPFQTGTRVIGVTAAGPGTVAFSAPAYTIGEGGTAEIALTRTGGDGIVTVVVTAGGVERAVTFLPGETLKQVNVATSKDGATGDRSVPLTLKRAAGGPVIATPAATLTVANTDVGGSSIAPDTAKPVALIVARDLRLSTLRSKGVSALLSVNEAARIEISLRFGSRTIAKRVVTTVNGATVKRVRATLTSNGKKAIGRSKTRRLQLRAVVTDAAGNRSTVTSAFSAKR